MTGIVLGSVIGSAAYQKPEGGFEILNVQTVSAVGGGLLGGIVGAAAGAIIGASVGGEKSYDISDREHIQKVEIIRTLMSEQK